MDAEDQFQGLVALLGASLSGRVEEQPEHIAAGGSVHSSEHFAIPHQVAQAFEAQLTSLQRGVTRNTREMYVETQRVSEKFLDMLYTNPAKESQNNSPMPWLLLCECWIALQNL